MEDARAILVLTICGISVISAFSGKGYFCRDPDTGFLYPANSTWQSKSFCGNYTCKLRSRLNHNEKPLRTLNVTFTNNSQTNEPRNSEKKVTPETDGQTENIENDTQSEIILPVDVPELAILKNLLPSGQIDLSKLNIQERFKQQQSSHDASENADRYLTEAEIKNIAELLHNVKKSDLEAIVDIYTLAQDIYKEMDKVTSENIVEETMKYTNVLTDKTENKKISYWYEPSYRYKQPEGKTDMDFQGSNIATSITPPQVENTNTYYSGPLLSNNYGKVPYYYPISNFQKQSSYIHPTYYSQPPQQPQVTERPPCNNPINQNLSPVVHQNFVPSVPYNAANAPQNYGGVLKKPFPVEAQKPIHPSNLLPYPFSYIQHYNMSGYPLSSFFEGEPWYRFDIANKHNQKSFYKSSLPENPSMLVPVNSEREANIKLETDQKKTDSSNLLDMLLEHAIPSKAKPDWQTDPLPSKVLDEVRAHFEKKTKLLKPLSLRKKVKLERVGKVLKMEELRRERRSLNDKKLKIEKEDLETYIEKTTCLSDTDPGYFRMGNISEPYPACCPQRITNSSR